MTTTAKTTSRAVSAKCAKQMEFTDDPNKDEWDVICPCGYRGTLGEHERQD